MKMGYRSIALIVSAFTALSWCSFQADRNWWNFPASPSFPRLPGINYAAYGKYAAVILDHLSMYFASPTGRQNHFTRRSTCLC